VSPVAVLPAGAAGAAVLPEVVAGCPPHAAKENAINVLSVIAAHFFNIILSPLLFT